MIDEDAPPPPGSPGSLSTVSSVASRGRDARSHRILIVEDFSQTSNFLSSALNYCRSAHCVCASSGEDALDIIAGRGRFDLILTDVMMKGIGGLEFMRRVRRLEHEEGWTAQTIVSLSADEANSERALAAGASSFVCKYNSPLSRIFEILDTLRPATPPPTP